MTKWDALPVVGKILVGFAGVGAIYLVWGIIAFGAFVVLVHYPNLCDALARLSP